MVWPLRCGIEELKLFCDREERGCQVSRRTSESGYVCSSQFPFLCGPATASGKDSLEFATAINISAGGALVVVRRSLPKSSLDFTGDSERSHRTGHGLPSSSRVMRAKAVWVAHLDDYHLLGLKFARPLSTDAAACPASIRGKLLAAV